MAEEEADETSSGSCSCEDDDHSNSAKYEESIITTDNDLEDDIEIIESRRKTKNADKGYSTTNSDSSADNPSTSRTIVDTTTVISCTVDANIRPITCNNTKSDIFSRSSVNLSNRKNIRTVLPYPSELGSFKVRSQVIHNDFLYRPSDIVSLTEDDRIYFAQIKFLVENTFCEKYAAIIWLIPNSPEFVQNAPFNPDVFIYGPQDENFYTMNAITFVMHAPTPYFKRFIPPVPEASNLNRPQPEKSKRRKGNKRDDVRLPMSIADLM